MPEVQHQLASTLAPISARLVDDHDADAVLRLVTGAGAGLLGASASGVLVVDPRGGIRVASASDERARFVELLQAHTEQGPCAECVRTGEAVESADLAGERRWPAFARAAVEAGYQSVHAVPMRLDGRTVGVLTLFYGVATALQPWQRQLSQLLADLAILGLSQESGPRRADRLVERTLTRFNDRIEMAHAVGIVAGSLEIEPDQARMTIEQYAARRGGPVWQIARELTSGALKPVELL